MSRFVVPLVIFLALASAACGRSEVVQGVVESKTVSGTAESASFSVLQNRPAHDPDAVNDRPYIVVKDQDFRGFFTPDDDHAVITLEMENELRRKFSDIGYVVNVRLPRDGGTQPYFVSRDVFNRMLVDGPVRFEASGSPIPTVRKLLEPRV